MNDNLEILVDALIESCIVNFKPERIYPHLFKAGDYSSLRGNKIQINRHKQEFPTGVEGFRGESSNVSPEPVEAEPVDTPIIEMVEMRYSTYFIKK